MEREIGSEFWTEAYQSLGIQSILAQWAQPVLTVCGRTALDIIVEDILSSSQPKRVYMPSYCCHTMIEPFLRHGITAEFYNVYPTMEGFCCDFQSNKCDVVFLIDYFGFADPETEKFAQAEKNAGKTVVRDVTHSMFRDNKQETADYIIGSFRKWFGVNAGFAAKRTPWQKVVKLRQTDDYCTLRNRTFDLKARYNNTLDPEQKRIFLDMFRKAEEMIEHDYHACAPDPRSLLTLNTIDIEKIRKSRRENAKYLMQNLKDINGLLLPYQGVKNDDCPLFVPVCCDDRDGLKQHLIQDRIYCPSHWPVSSLHKLNDRSYELYKTELSLICDQRYVLGDMRRMVNSIRMFFNSDNKLTG